MKLRLENLPASLQGQREALRRCLDAFNRVTPVRSVYLFGPHTRNEARADSDVDLCIVADGAERQQETARRYREAIWEIWPRPSLTLIPISPARLAEKQSIGDHFFATVFKEGVLLASKD
jgi:predicted nucleotidyltransferase